MWNLIAHIGLIVVGDRVYHTFPAIAEPFSNQPLLLLVGFYYAGTLLWVGIDRILAIRHNKANR